MRQFENYYDFTTVNYAEKCIETFKENTCSLSKNIPENEKYRYYPDDSKGLHQKPYLKIGFIGQSSTLRLVFDTEEELDYFFNQNLNHLKKLEKKENLTIKSY